MDAGYERLVYGCDATTPALCESEFRACSM